MNTSYFLFMIYFIWIDTITRKQHHINRSVEDDPFALDGFGDCMFEFEIFKIQLLSFSLQSLLQLQSSVLVVIIQIFQMKKINMITLCHHFIVNRLAFCLKHLKDPLCRRWQCTRSTNTWWSSSTNKWR